MRPEDLPETRRPIGDAPRWIAVHAIGGFSSFFLLSVLDLVIPGDDPDPYRALLTVITVLTLASMAWFYASRRRTMTKLETTYLRIGIVVVALTGLQGTWFLSVPVGVALYAWTIVERRRLR